MKTFRKPIFRYLSVLLALTAVFVPGKSFSQEELYCEEDMLFSVSDYVEENALAEPRPIVRATSIANSHVPSLIVPDKSKTVGEIPFSSGVTSSGARVYEIPIEVYPGINGMQPKLSFSYNSQQGKSFMGQGWSISGFSTISRVPKNMYYDAVTEPIRFKADDAFSIDGTRLVRIGKGDGYIVYESEQGNIKAKGYHTGDIIKWFEVFFPDGTCGKYGDVSAQDSRLNYPLMSLSDLYGNSIEYRYTYSYNVYRPEMISYGKGVNILLSYETRPDPIYAYVAGKLHKTVQRLSSVEIRFDSSSLRKYKLRYDEGISGPVLTEIELSAGQQLLNPLRFYYGTGKSGTGFECDSIKLAEKYEISSPNAVCALRGRLDYRLSPDGIIAFPNYNPYYERDYTSHTFGYNVKEFVNGFPSDTKISVFPGLDNKKYEIDAGEGFTDILTVDLNGNQEESIVKINHTLDGNKEKLTFTVYRAHSDTGIEKLYTRSYSFSSVYTDARGRNSVNPKFFMTGDFNGDGRMEILAVSSDHPFGSSTLPTQLYLFDLENDKILYQGGSFQYKVTFVGDKHPYGDEASANSDRLLPIDYDGDGKTDLIHIGEDGISALTFYTEKGSLFSRETIPSSILKRADLVNRELNAGDINGDGLVDLILSCPDNVTGSDWKKYISKGNGLFEAGSFAGPKFYLPIDPKLPEGWEEPLGYMLNDVNGDGKADIVAYDKKGFDVMLADKDGFSSETTRTLFSGGNFVFLPTNISSRNFFISLLQLKEQSITAYSFGAHGFSETMLTGVAGSMGNVEKTEYTLINDKGAQTGLFTRGDGQELSTFPYVSIQEPLPVVSGVVKYLEGTAADSYLYTYKNAVLHRQGLGFRGFAEISETDRRGYRKVTVYDPYNYGVVKKETAPDFINTYEYTVTAKPDKRVKVLLSNKKEEDRLRKTILTTSYTYDSFGYPLIENSFHLDGTQVKTTCAYASDTTLAKGYNLGYLRDKTVMVAYGKDTYTTRDMVSSFSKRNPLTIIRYIDGNKSATEYFTYDSVGHEVSHSVKKFTSSTNLKSTKRYDAKGRISGETDEMGIETSRSYNSRGEISSETDRLGGVTSYTYDSFGRLKRAVFPDGTEENTSYEWSEEGINSRYCVSTERTGKPLEKTYYDAFGREVRRSDMRFNGVFRNVDIKYDVYGNISKESYPFTAGTASLWISYSHDRYGRLTRKDYGNGKVTTHSYDGLTVRTTEDGIPVKRIHDCLGNLVAVSDSTGTVSYTLAADGQPLSVNAHGNAVTEFTYDKYRRRISLTDPSSGKSTTEYTADGYVSKETDANGVSVSHGYDRYGRLTWTVHPEFTTKYSYSDLYGLLTASTSEGVSTTLTYDSLGRVSTQLEEAPDGVTLRKTFFYKDGNVNSIKYRSYVFADINEKRSYKNGHLVEITVNDTASVYKLVTENALGQPTRVQTGPLTRSYGFSAYGLPIGRRVTKGSETIQYFSYTFDPATSCLTSRTDNKRKKSEYFTYDSMNRLISHQDGEVEYDGSGNITSRSEIGRFSYSMPGKPYAVSSVTPTGNRIPQKSQKIEYTSFRRPSLIVEGTDTTWFSYGHSYDRVRKVISLSNGKKGSKYYLGGCYEATDMISLNVIVPRNAPVIVGKVPTVNIAHEFFYIGGDYYDSPAVYTRSGNVETINYLLRDYLGSVTHVVSHSGYVRQELSYDAWGALRDPETHEVYEPGEVPSIVLERGYTGHEHILKAGLINMNARLYDPAVGRFLSPDPFVQMPDLTQNFNRYSYCLNNPLCYIDEDGEIFWTIVGVGALIGAFTNVAANWDAILSSSGWDAVWKGVGYAVIGGIAGGAGAAAGTLTAMSFCATSVTISSLTSSALAAASSGVINGASIGLATGAASGFINGVGNSLIGGEKFGQALWNGVNEAAYEAAIGGVLGGIGGGIEAAFRGDNIWTGSPKNNFVETLLQEYTTVTQEFSSTSNDICSYSLTRSPEYPYTGYFGYEDEIERYVGITAREPYLRFAEHLRSNSERKFLRYRGVRYFKTRLDARIWEQNMINKHGMRKFGGALYNRRNEISPSKWNLYNIKP